VTESISKTDFISVIGEFRAGRQRGHASSNF